MARIGEQGAAVRKHTDEGCDMASRREIVEVLFHAHFIVEEPPRGTVLDFSACLVALEAADERHILCILVLSVALFGAQGFARVAPAEGVPLHALFPSVAEGYHVKGRGDVCVVAIPGDCDAYAVVRAVLL